MRRMLAAVAVAGLAASALAVGLVVPAGAGAPTVNVTITKAVVGTDPGVAFTIVLSCSAEDTTTTTAATMAIPQIPDAGDGPLTQTVSLKGGESTTVQIELPAAEPTSATCAVSEDPAATALPEGYSCSAAVAPESAVVYDTLNGAQDAAFTVTNTCSLVASITFTG